MKRQQFKELAEIIRKQDELAQTNVAVKDDMVYRLRQDLIAFCSRNDISNEFNEHTFESVSIYVSRLEKQIYQPSKYKIELEKT